VTLSSSWIDFKLISQFSSTKLSALYISLYLPSLLGLGLPEVFQLLSHPRLLRLVSFGIFTTMSRLLAIASPLKPEIRLAQAVSQFEADLSSHQKATFRTYRFQTQNDPPDARDVMRLTAEIDRHTGGKSGGGRCFGPRMTNFLYAVQKFAAIGDVIVGGSQNLIACGIWSIVRISLLVSASLSSQFCRLLIHLQSIASFSPYLEKLSGLLMNVGRSAPRYENMALLYPRSKKLQSHLSEYFIVVVGLCRTLFRYTQKSPIEQFTSSLSDSELKSYQSDLGIWANSIKEEVGLLMAEKIEEEAKENARFRALSKKSSLSASLEQKIKTRLRILDFCSTYDYVTPWKQTRKLGHAALFNLSADYQDWKCQENSCTLLYTGKLGSGKSVMLANIVDDINLHVRKKDIVVAYYFCRFDSPESLNATTVIGSLARQLLSPISDLEAGAELLKDAASVRSFESIVHLLQRTLSSTYKAYFILDGLDECDDDERTKLIPQLRKLQDTFSMLLCVSFRLEPNSARKLSSEKFMAPRIISIPEDNPDIENFVDAELEDCLNNQKLVIGNPILILEIRNGLLQRSQGMFLWVALQIVSLCEMKTDEAIRQALVDLPRDLSETFSRIIARSEVTGQLYQRRILEPVTVAQRPLQLEELREALSVVPGNTDWNPAKLLNNIYSTMACCGSLVIVDEEELTIRFVHRSVKQFLLTRYNVSSSIRFTRADAHKTLADTIATYLNYGIFGTQMSTRVVPRLIAESAPAQIIHSTLESPGSVLNLALKLLKSTKLSNHDIGKTLAEASNNFIHVQLKNFTSTPMQSLTGTVMFYILRN
jgi:hypothetical protein